MNICEAMTDEKLFGDHFQGESWSAWQVVLRAIFALSMSECQQAIFKELTARDDPPTIPAEEVWLVAGRRSGKSQITALIATYLAFFRDYTPYLSPGEIGLVMCLASDRRQARVLKNYIGGLISEVPMLQAMVVNETRESIELSNGITIEIHASNFRGVRGHSIVACLADEIAFWRDENSANPDREVLDAVRPGMATIPNSLLVALGSPYRRSGAMWQSYQDHFGKEGDPVLVVQAESRQTNPSLLQKVIDRAYERDPASASAEYGAEFRTDIGAFLDPAWLDAASSNRHELPPGEGITYVAFADPSGGRGDAFTLGIAHDEDGRRILDVIRRVKPPFDPSSVVAEYCSTLKCYGLKEVTGDNYAGEWVVEAFAEYGVDYRRSEFSKSQIYLETLPLFATGIINLPNDQNLLTELRQLERRTRSGGKDTVDHPPRGHDDAANAACGAILLAAEADIEITPDMYLTGPPMASADFPETSAGSEFRWQH